MAEALLSGSKRDFRSVTPEMPLELPSGQRMHFSNEMAVVTPPPQDEVVRGEPEAVMPFAGEELKDNMMLIRNEGMSSTAAAQYFKNYAEKSHLDEFMATAYASPSGVAIRVNPYTGLKEMVIAGTRGPGDWGRNIIEGADSIVSAGLHKITNLIPEGVFRERAEGVADVLETISVPGRFSKELSRAEMDELLDHAREDGVEVIYAHSRAAALLEYIPDGEFTTIGLDGANIVGYQPMRSPNFSSDDIFSRTIGIGSVNRVELPGRPFHNVTRDAKKDAAAKKIRDRRKKSQRGVDVSTLKKEFYQQADKASRRQKVKLVERAHKKIGKNFAKNLAKYAFKEVPRKVVGLLPGGEEVLALGNGIGMLRSNAVVPAEGDTSIGLVPTQRKRGKELTSREASKYARTHKYMDVEEFD